MSEGSTTSPRPDQETPEFAIYDGAESNPGIRYLLDRSGVPARQVIRSTYEFLVAQAVISDTEVPSIPTERMERLRRNCDTLTDHLNLCTDEVRQRAEVRDFLDGINPNFRREAVMILKAAKDAAAAEELTEGRDAAAA